MWREREKCRGGRPPRQRDARARRASARRCTTRVCRCCAAPDGRDDFPALSRALLSQMPTPRKYKASASTRAKYWFRRWVSEAHWFLIFYLALSILGVWTLACCVSNRCCYAFGTLQKIRNEFADSCPTLATYLNKLCVEPCKLGVKWCCCCCMCCKAQRVKKPDLQTAIEVGSGRAAGAPMAMRVPGRPRQYCGARRRRGGWCVCGEPAGDGAAASHRYCQIMICWKRPLEI